MSKIRFIVDYFPLLPRWYPESGFGTPFLRFYPPFSYYLAAFTMWILRLNIFEGCKVYFMLVLSIGAISTYALAKEIGLKRIGCLASGLLLLGSYNIYSWWWIGQLPNITAVMFTPLALLGFLRAIRRQTIFNTLLAGLLYAPVLLSHLLNALILGVILLCTGVFMIFLRPELLFISRGERLPPKYTLIPPKVLFFSMIEAVALSSWWYLPLFTGQDLSYFLAEQTGYGVISAGESARTIALKPEFFLVPAGIGQLHPASLYYLGVGHLLLAIICLVFVIRNRKKVQDTYFLPSFWFFVAVFGGISPYLGIPMGLPYRFGPYIALAASLMGGIAISALEDFYVRLMRSRFLAFLLSALLLLGILYQPIMEAKNNFSMVKAYPPSPSVWLPNVIGNGERLGSRSANWVNAFSNIPQSYGAEEWTNEFAYKFWYYMFYNHTSAYVSYFARSFNVRYFWEIPRESPYLIKVYDSIYEVRGFNSSLVEAIEGKILVLFIGDEVEYSRFFLSIALSDPEDIIPLYGGNTLDEYDVATLRSFDAVYLTALKRKDPSNLPQILSGYVKGGGCLILDTGNIEHESEIVELPDPFPVKTVAVGGSYLAPNLISSHNVTKNVDFAKFSTDKPYKITYATSIRGGSSTLIYDQDRPLLVYWEQGSGRVFWIGLRLPYLIMLNEGDEAKSKEIAKFLINLLGQAKSAKTESSKGIAHFEQTNLEEIIIYVRNASSQDAIWVKMSYYTGWTAQIQDEAHTQLRIFKTGPNMMLVFPEKSGDYTVRFYFDKTIDVKVGEYISLLSIIALPIVGFCEAVRKKKEVVKGV